MNTDCAPIVRKDFIDKRACLDDVRDSLQDEEGVLLDSTAESLCPETGEHLDWILQLDGTMSTANHVGV